MARVLLKELTKYFGEVVAVESVNLEIEDKEFLVLVGPSGCGKTTCLRMIAGLEEPTGGEIHIGERLVNDISPKDRDIAMVFQNYALYPHMSVFDNMAFGLKLRKMPRDEIRGRVDDAAEMLGLEGLLERKPKELSGGQRQRVALGRAIVREPAVFLMDEPLSNLDAKLRVQTRAELIKLHRRLGITTVYVTHDQVEAMTMGDRIVVLKDGLVQQVDTPLGLYSTPANLFVAGFIGSPPMNFVDCTLSRDDGTIWVDADPARLRVPDAEGHDLEGYVGRPMVFGIRPEHMYDRALSPGVPPSDGNTVRMGVEVIEPMGATSVLYLNCGDHSLLASIDSATQAQEQGSLDVVFDMAKAHLFDAETEQTVY
ncbi:MAG: sn-glycerol-3-phosphate ABC transporter ATP-binding protein UgpC [Armatimonadota bacterium]|jgi:multiple sugar transport system ATP-binding protein